MDDSAFQIRAFPDDAFQCDGVAQARMNEVTGLRLRRFTRCLVGMFLIFAGIILCAGIGGQMRSFIWVLGACFVLFLAYGMLLILRNPPLRCSECRKKFRKRWVASPGSGKDLFLVCEPCRRYVFTHLNSD